MLPPFGVTGSPEPVAGAKARPPDVTVVDNTVRTRSPTLATAFKVADCAAPAPENTRTVPFGIAAVNGSTTKEVPALSVASAVTICLPVIRQTIRLVELVPVSLKIAIASTEAPETAVNVVSAASATPATSVADVRVTFAPTIPATKSSQLSPDAD